MCQFKSAICLKDRVFVPDYDSHSAMLEELRIPDDMRHATETFVRVECSPADGDKTSDPMGWQVVVDQDILPDWFMPEVDYPRIKEAVKAWCDVHVLRKGNHKVNDGVWIATGSATVRAFGRATVRASGSATVEAYGSATVVLPVSWQTNNPVTLGDNAICVNHADHTIRSSIKWSQVD